MLGTVDSLADESIADSFGCLFAICAICMHIPSIGFGEKSSPPVYDIIGFVHGKPFEGGVIYVTGNPILVKEVCNNGM